MYISVTQTHRDLPPFAYRILRLKACATKPGKIHVILKIAEVVPSLTILF